MTLLLQLENEPPITPSGTFRWLYFHFAFRYPTPDRHAQIRLREMGLPEFATRFDYYLLKNPAKTYHVARRHAWGLGYLGLTDLGEKCWPQFSPEARGSFLAGLTEVKPTDETRSWCRSHMTDIQLLPESGCQLACNACRYREPEIFQAVMACEMDWNARVRRANLNNDDVESEWDDDIARLSERLVDLILDATLQANDVSGARHALAKGANPNLRIWRLERSFNERQCALSYCVHNDHSEMIQLLLEYGASARGTVYGDLDKPLHYALRREVLAQNLLSRGAMFRSRPTGAALREARRYKFLWKASSDERDWVWTAIGSLLPLVELETKALFYTAGAQGGYWETNLKPLLHGDRADLIRLYEAHGLDVRLCAEEVLTAIECGARESLSYLLTKHGDSVRKEAFKRIGEYSPDFDLPRRA